MKRALAALTALALFVVVLLALLSEEQQAAPSDDVSRASQRNTPHPVDDPVDDDHPNQTQETTKDAVRNSSTKTQPSSHLGSLDPQHAVTQPAGTGEISGRILLSNGSPVEGAEVQLKVSGLEAQGGVLMMAVDGMTRTTDGSGRFRFQDLPAGRHLLEVEHSGPGLRLVRTPDNDEPETIDRIRSAGRAVRLPPGGRRHVEVVLEDTAALLVRCDPPVPVTLRLFQRVPRYPQAVGGFEPDPDPLLTVYDLKPGQWTDGYEPGPWRLFVRDTKGRWASAKVRLRPGDNEVALKLLSLAQLEIVVTDPGGKPVAVDLHLLPTNTNHFLAFPPHDDEGVPVGEAVRPEVLEVPESGLALSLPDGEWRLIAIGDGVEHAWTQARARLEAGKRRRVEVRLRPARTVTVRGLPDGARITVHGPFGIGLEVAAGPGVVDPEGARPNQLPPGTMRVFGLGAGDRATVVVLADGQAGRVEIGPDTTLATVTLEAPVQLRCQVVDSTGQPVGAGVGYRLLPDYRVHPDVSYHGVFAFSGVSRFLREEERYTREGLTDEKGRVELDDLVAGTWTLQVEGSSRELRLRAGEQRRVEMRLTE